MSLWSNYGVPTSFPQGDGSGDPFSSYTPAAIAQQPQFSQFTSYTPQAQTPQSNAATLAQYGYTPQGQSMQPYSSTPQATVSGDGNPVFSTYPSSQGQFTPGTYGTPVQPNNYGPISTNPNQSPVTQPNSYQPQTQFPTQNQYGAAPAQFNNTYAATAASQPNMVGLPQGNNDSLAGATLGGVLGQAFPGLNGSTVGGQTGSVAVNPRQPANQTTPYITQTPVPLPWQQQQASLAQLAANAQYQNIMNQYAQMYGLAGSNQAFLQNQNQQNTNAAVGRAQTGAISSGLGVAALPSEVAGAQYQGNLGSQNIAANAAQQKLGVLGQQASAMQTLPAPLGNYSPTQVSNQASQLFGNAANLGGSNNPFQIGPTIM